jgi:hypothetical protein
MANIILVAGMSLSAHIVNKEILILFCWLICVLLNHVVCMRFQFRLCLSQLQVKLRLLHVWHDYKCLTWQFAAAQSLIYTSFQCHWKAL